MILAAVIAVVLGGGAGAGLALTAAKAVSAEFDGLSPVDGLYAIAPGESVDVRLTSEPGRVFLDTLSVTSSRPSVLRVTEADGAFALQGVAAGEAEVTVTSSRRQVAATYSFMVSEPPEAIEDLPQDVVLDPDEVLKLEPAVVPAESMYPFGFKSSDPAVVEVDADGVLTGKTAGAATITVTCGKVTREVAVDVHRKVQSVSLSPASADLTVGESLQIEATVEPADAAVKTLTYASSNSQAASVSATGLVFAPWTALGDRSVTITVSSPEGPSAEFDLRVVNPYEANAAGEPSDIPGTPYSVTPTVFATAVPNCVGLTIGYGVGEASSSAYLSELRSGSFDVYALGASGGWEKVGSLSLGGQESTVAEVTFGARTVSQVAVVPSASSGSGTTWRSATWIEDVVFEGQPPAQGDT
jgi:hypothetical protein